MSFHAGSQASTPRQSLKTLPHDEIKHQLDQACAVHLAQFLPWHQKPEQFSAAMQVERVSTTHEENTVTMH